MCVPLLVFVGCSKAPSPDRAAKAVAKARPKVEQLAKKADLNDLPDRIYFRAFKEEETLEIWGAMADGEAMRLIAEYPIARMSGRLGPKRKEGDYQVPEGLYFIDRFNPESQFHLSLGLNYPNASDKIRSDKERPGGDIFIHGNKVSVGCMAMTDPVIEEIWTIAIYARDAGQRNIPVHVFPARMDDKTMVRLLGEYDDPELKEIWLELELFYDAFERSHLVPSFTVDSSGTYRSVE